MINILTENTYIQLLIVGLILASIYFLLTRRRIKLNEPPIADYRIPIIGHTLKFVWDCDKLIVESRKKYGDIFSIYIFGQVMTVVAKEMTFEVFKNDHDFNIYLTPEVKLLTDCIFTEAAKDIHKAVKVFRGFFKSKLISLTGTIQQHIIKGMDTYIGECNEPKVISDPQKIMQNIVSVVAANIIVEDFAHYEDILDLFNNLIHSVLKAFFAPKILSFVSPWFHNQVASFSLRFISTHKKIITNRIKPIVEKRFREKRKLGDAWIAPNDALQLLLNDPEVAPDLDPSNVNYNFIADTIGVFIFAAIATTSSRASYIAYDLGRRKEYWDELYEEAQEINKQCNGKLKYSDLDKMVKLNNFIKENFRINTDVLSVPRRCVSESHYTFATGHQVPSGRLVGLDVMDINYDENRYSQNPKKFDACHHNSPATTIGRDFVVFGYGKHVCPGKNFAVTILHIFAHQILLKYNVRPVFENVEPRNYLGFLLGPMEPGKGSIVFENNSNLCKHI